MTAVLSPTLRRGERITALHPALHHVIIGKRAAPDLVGFVFGNDHFGRTVRKARAKTYRVVDEIHFPDRIFRSDIGESLEACLPELHRFGWAADMDY